MMNKKIKKVIIGISALSIIAIVSGLLIYSNGVKKNNQVTLASNTKNESSNKDANKDKKKKEIKKEEKNLSETDSNKNVQVSDNNSNTQVKAESTIKSYDVISREISSDKSKVFYPYVNNGSNYINDLLKTKIVTVMNTSLEGSNFDLCFNLGLNKNNIISVNYKGIVTNQQSAHPSKIDFGVTVDMNSSKELELKDLFVVNDDFYNIIRNYNPQAETEELKNAQKEFINGQSNEDLKKCYESYYLENDGVVLIFSTYYAISEHVEIKVPYSALSGFMNFQI